MNLRIGCLALALFWLGACGIQRPLVRPADIPEYERKREEKLRKRQIDPPRGPEASAIAGITRG